MNTRLPIRDVILDLVGVVGLLLKRSLSDALKNWGSDSLSALSHSYWGNLAVSFAVYFLVSIAARTQLNRVAIALLALGVVEGFEFTNGFGIMTNVYDPLDYLANAVGVALAYVVDVVSSRVVSTDRVIA